MAGKFEIYKDKGGKFRLRLKDEDGSILAASPISNSWDNVADANAQVEKIRASLQSAEVEVVA